MDLAVNIHRTNFLGSMVTSNKENLMEKSQCCSQMAKVASSKTLKMESRHHLHEKGLRQKRTGSKSVPDSQTFPVGNSTEPAETNNSTPTLSLAPPPPSLPPPVAPSPPHLHRLLSLSHSRN